MSLNARAVFTGDIAIDTDAVYTCGMNTCMFLCISTKKYVIGWHFSWENTQGLNMLRVRHLLDTVKDVQNVCLIPGADRQIDLSLNPECRTMREHPNVDPQFSAEYFIDFISQYEWADNVRVCWPINHYKEFVRFDRKDGRPCIARNDEAFDKMCYYDAG